jgi:regulator of sirC expression with transglutaminase-like and TPR domain
MDVTGRFAALVAGPPEAVPLDEALLLVAAHDHPVDRRAERARLDALAERCRPDLPGVLEVLFEEEGFRGGDEDYHHPDNSFLDRVLDRRRGLPILLSVVTAEVAARCGVCLAPVGMPGHFLLRDCEGGDTFIDPFNGGRLLDRQDCAGLFSQLHPGQPFDERFLDPIDSRAVLVRVVTNLVHAYTRRGSIGSLAWALRLRAELVGGETWLHVARLGERTGDWLGAATAWDRLAAAGARGAEAAPARAAAARARVN